MKITQDKLTAFCAVLSETCNVGKACKAIDISRYTAYKWRKEIPEFAEAWEESMSAGITMLEDEAHRRAFEGNNKPLVHQGQMTYQFERDEKGQLIFDDVSIDIPNAEPKIERVPRLVVDEKGQPIPQTVKEYSDTLAIFLLKAHAPEKYRENSRMELTGADGGPVEVDDKAAAARLAGLIALAQKRKDADDEYGDVSDLL